jgi:uncharacterized protein (DUF1499 family)
MSTRSPIETYGRTSARPNKSRSMPEKWRLVFIAVIIMALSGCSGKHLNVADDNSLSLESCFPLPCCVSSNAWLFYNNVDPFVLNMPEADAWPLIKKAVADIPRTRIVEEDSVYIHAKCTSLVFRFVDNLELLLLPDRNLVSVRSSSTFAIFDFGANHLRVYRLRSQLREAGIIQ